MKIWICNYLGAQAFLPTQPTLAIRIFDPRAETGENTSERKLADSPLWVAQLQYSFEDIDLTSYESEDPETFQRLQRDRKCFDSLVAAHLIKEVSKHLPAAKEIMVHCNAGISRSVAVASAINHRFKLQAEWGDSRTRGVTRDRVGNPWIYHLLLDSP